LIVIPAKAGIHVATVKVKMDPRLRGDDASVANRRDASRLLLGRMRHFVVIPAKAGIHVATV
jgi:hypothetical protein